MAAAGLSAKSIVNHAQTVRLVLASATTGDGEPLYPRKWNPDFVWLPVVKKEEQYRPTINSSEIEEILSASKGRYKALFALLAGTGLRIGEALALRPSDFTQDCCVLNVRRATWRGIEQSPKTANAIREIDLAGPLAEFLQEYMAGKKQDAYLFATASGRPLSQRNVLRALHACHKIGLHAFRRFRTETLRRAAVPQDIERLWLGHASASVTDWYAKGIQLDKAWRREWCNRAGLGFTLIRLTGLTSAAKSETSKAA